MPASTTTVVTNIIVANTSDSSGTYTLRLNEVLLADQVTVAAKDSVVLDIKQVLNAEQILAGGASATTINFHIGGVEIS